MNLIALAENARFQNLEVFKILRFKIEKIPMFNSNSKYSHFKTHTRDAT